MGRLNSDCWYRYFTIFCVVPAHRVDFVIIPVLILFRYLFTLELPEYWENKQADQTLEVLMSDLDPAVMDQFYMKDGVSANDVTRVRATPPFSFSFHF